MHLISLLHRLDLPVPAHSNGITVTGITCHSDKIKPGHIFVVLKGLHKNGRDFIGQALQKGAVALMTNQKLPPQPVPVIHTKNPRLMWAKAAACLFPIKKLKVLAVTGTNGKTSTVYFVEQMLNKLGIPAASMGTIGIQSPLHKEFGHLTLAEPDTLYQKLQFLEKKGIKVVAMEASSQGLHQERLSGLQTDASAFTNLTQDHLDYHKTFANYLRCKMLLFTQRTKKGATAVLNADIPEYKQQRRQCLAAGLKPLSYGANATDIRLLSTENQGDCQTMDVKADNKEYHLTLPMSGDFQVSNALCAVGLCMGLGIKASKLLPLLEHITPPVGRMELVGILPNLARVYVDYAHTPDALEHVLSSLRQKNPARLTALFGARGNRDQTKRPLMGRLAAALADKVYITDDDTDTENPDIIRAMLLSGCPGAIEIPDRATAITYAIKHLTEREILVIMGKGHENFQITRKGVKTYSDIAHARYEIKKMKGTPV